MSEVIPLKTVCRLCLSWKDAVFPIFDCLEHYENVIEMIQSCTLVEILRTDEVSKICFKCLNLVKQFYSFRLRVKEAQKVLHAILGANKKNDVRIELTTNFIIDQGLDHLLSVVEEKDTSSENIQLEQQVISDEEVKEKGTPSMGRDAPSESSVSSVENIFIDYNLSESCPENTSAEPANLYELEHAYCATNRSFEDLLETEPPSNPFGKNHLPNNYPVKNHRYKKTVCDMRKKRFSNAAKLRLHQSTCFKRDKYNCPTCDQRFDTDLDLKLHLPTHEKLSCTKCSFSTFNLSNLKAHERKHNILPFKCEDVDKSHFKKGSSKYNREGKHLSPNEMHVCDICNKAFPHKASLVAHKISHDPHTNIFSCQVCEKKCTCSSDVKKRMDTTHLGNRYTSDVCSRQETSLQSLEIHRRTHTGERFYQCEACSKGFTNKTDLIIHVRTHTGEKPYLCGICKRRFSQKSSLNVHVRTHTGEKPYACETCNKRFSTRALLNNHVKVRHKIKSKPEIESSVKDYP